MKYRPEIDGLRAIAVVPVILFHAGFANFGGGFVGVDVFFVISGYLITMILIDEVDRGSYSIISFYERRARRILPALFFVMACCLPFAWAWMLPWQLKDFSQSIVAVVAFASNILFWLESGYFGGAAELKPLLHTWSLAVEEQYYLVFPIFIALAWRFGRRQLFTAILAIAVASVLFSEWGARKYPDANFYLAPTRAWELLVGSLCAFWMNGRTRRSNELLAATGLAFIFVAILFYDSLTPIPSLYSLAPVGGAALIIIFGTDGTKVARILSLRPFVWIGLISYSAYLWHQPLFAFARIRSVDEPAEWQMLTLAVLSLVLAFFSWRFVERPFRGTPASILPSRGLLFGAAAAVGLVFVTFGLAGHYFDGYRELYKHRFPAYSVSFDAIEKTRVSIDISSLSSKKCINHFDIIDEMAANKILDCYNEFGQGVIVFGDSHAIDLYRVVARQYEGEFLVGVSMGGCRPHTPNQNCPYRGILEFIEQNPKVFMLAVYEQAGFYLLHTATGEEGNRDMFGKIPLRNEVPQFSVNKENISIVTEYLEKISFMTPAVWLGPRIEPHISMNAFLRYGCDYDFQLRKGIVENFRRLDDYLQKRLSGLRTEFVSQNDLFKLSFPKDLGGCNGIFWSDGDHFSDVGEEHFSKRVNIIPVILKMMDEQVDESFEGVN